MMTLGGFRSPGQPRFTAVNCPIENVFEIRQQERVDRFKDIGAQIRILRQWSDADSQTGISTAKIALDISQPIMTSRGPRGSNANFLEGKSDIVNYDKNLVGDKIVSAHDEVEGVPTLIDGRERFDQNGLVMVTEACGDDTCQ